MATKGYSRAQPVKERLGGDLLWLEKGGGGRGRQRAQQRAQYDELDKYPVMPPHAFARIVRDKRTLNIIYQIIEPPMTKKEQEQREEIMDIFIRSLTANIEEIDGNLKLTFEQQWTRSSNPTV